MVENEPNKGLADFPPLMGSDGSVNNLEIVTLRKAVGGSGSNGVRVSSLSSPREWRTLFPSAKPIKHQIPLKFFPSAELDGKKVVDYAAGDFSTGIKRCEEYVVGFCVGKRLSFPAIKEAVSKLWNLKNEVSIKLHSNCAFIFEFMDEEDRKKVLELGSFNISNCLFIVRPWSCLLESTISSIRTIPIWVLIYNVPLQMWDIEGLSLISSFLGKPLLADDFTINRTRLSYARICIEVDVDFNYPESIPLMIDGKIALEMPVEYHWKPPKCDLCKVFGHSSKNCTQKLKPRWNPKKHGKDIEKVQETFQSKARESATCEKATVEVDNIARGAVQSTIEFSQGISSRVDIATSVSSIGKGSKEAVHKSVEDTTLDINAGKNCKMVKEIQSNDKGKQDFAAKIPIKSASTRPIGNGSVSKSAGVPASTNHRPFHLSSDFPYQWKDLSKDNVDKRDNKVKETEAVSASINKGCSLVKIQATPPIKSASITPESRNVISAKNGATTNNVDSTNEDGNWKIATYMKSPVKMVATDKEGTSITTSSDTNVKVNNTFGVLSNENQHSFQDKDGVVTEECEEDSEEFYNVESDKYDQYLMYEDKSKKIAKERSRLKWNGEIPNENLGKGHRSAARKHK